MGARLLIVAAAAGALTATAGARMIAPPGNESEADRLELNTAGDNSPSPSQREGLLCPWAIHANMLEVGRRCGVTANPAFQAELERSVSLMEAYARRQSPARAAEMAAWVQREVNGDARLCDPEMVAAYSELGPAELARLRQDTDNLLAGSPSLYSLNNCP
ncbi:MAG TPA: hypothetical protein VEC11_12800 [Allosphingosinicella sp.]|nr:hypothetical protein [Allosphingosinicella sp.]